MSTMKLPGSLSWNVSVPVGLDPPERVAVSLSVTRDAERATLGLVAVVRVGVAIGVSVSVAVLLVTLLSVTPAGGTTVTVFVIVPVALGLITPLSVMDTLWPLAKLSPLHAPVSGL